MRPARLSLLLLLAVVVAAILAVAAPARADNPDEEIAKAHFATGLSYYDSDRYAPAVKEFQEAYRLSKRPVLLYNIARAYERMNDAGHATVYYRRYLQAEPHASEAAEIRTSLTRMAPHVATLNVRTTVAGSEVAIDDEVVGEAPVDPQLVTEGKHHVSVRHAGYVAADVDVSLRGGQSTAIDANPVAAVVVQPEVAPPEQPAANPEPVKAPPLALTTTTTPPPIQPEAHRRWPWILVGVGAAVVAAGVAVVLALTLHGTDYSADGRANCQGSPSCMLVTF